LLAFMDILQLKAAVIIGGSSGGIVARRFAIDHPERTLGLVLIGSPFALKNKPGLQELWDSTISKMTDPLDPQIVREFAEDTLAQPVPQDFFETLEQENLKVPSRVWKATFKGPLEDDSSEELDKIRAPTLVIWGEQDAFLPLSDQKALAEAIAGSKFIVYPGAGHAFYWEDPARVVSDLVNFIEEITD